ncbi:MAG: GIY-YIG nuclease family protein [Candidatus Limivicinus sp.]
MNYVYMLRCGDGSLYTGWTNDLAARLAAHQAGRGGKYTRSHLPVELVYYELLPSRHEAMSRERQIKALRRREKLALISEKETRNNETN